MGWKINNFIPEVLPTLVADEAPDHAELVPVHHLLLGQGRAAGVAVQHRPELLQLGVVQQQLGAPLQELGPGLLPQLLLQHIVLSREALVKLGNDFVAPVRTRQILSFHVEILLFE